ncbi:hypothetical protein [Lactiplantibacillus mudanjiangensis]|uniref:Uncharacterized protein n=1 Tax=Lactiplantibacillus mudanjiangensis TaxID=1296538 RepID=A0A660DXE2_9LACO|nr:hypothetical protein [Lactiplantibacillus mudanjiangensis]VDG26361.1 hypothetical protein MUDAN_IGPPGNFN_01708 [Lactiplantibacillus mudanjiangensis]VDG27887.1 hypothetical protein MUDAN_MDHGFNIF_02703 [Lactiplantibacillus mudanjiangensis]
MSLRCGEVVIWIPPNFEVIDSDDKQLEVRSYKYKARFYGIVYRLKEPLAVIKVEKDLKKVPINQIAAFRWGASMVGDFFDSNGFFINKIGG